MVHRPGDQLKESLNVVNEEVGKLLADAVGHTVQAVRSFDLAGSGDYDQAKISLMEAQVQATLAQVAYTGALAHHLGRLLELTEEDLSDGS